MEMATRNWIECPVCARESGCGDDYAKPAGVIAKYKCEACRALDRKPRAPIPLAQAMTWATEQVGKGYTVHMRDLTTSRTVTFSRHFPPAGDPARGETMEVTDPTRTVIVCALK